MDRRSFIGAITGGLLAAPRAAETQPATRTCRVGGLWFKFPSVSAPFFEAFRDGLRELGYVEGQNIVFEQRWAERNPHRYPELAAELVRLKVDVIVAGNLESARVARDASSTIPIVLTAGGDPLRAGLVPSLARPAGNITGLSELGPDLAPKLLQLLKEAVPRPMPRRRRCSTAWSRACPRPDYCCSRIIGQNPSIAGAARPTSGKPA